MHRTITLVTAVVLAVFPISAHSAPIQWDVSSGGNGNFYDFVLVQDLITWSDANSVVEALAGDWYLATIASASESAFVESLLDSSQFTDCVSGTLAGTICNGLWIGATSSAIGANDWQWVTGESFSFTDWGPFEPFRNGDRIRLDWFLSQSVFAWNDARNTLNPARGYVLELNQVTAVPEPGTLLLSGLGIIGLAIRTLRRTRRLARTVEGRR
jgi:hypothetical protein